MMKVLTKRIAEVELDPEAVEKVFKTRLKQLCGGEGVYIESKTGKVRSWEDTGHGSGITEDVTGVTPIQLAALRLQEAFDDERRAEATARETARVRAIRKERRKEKRA